jgi:hypothetical protein
MMRIPAMSIMILIPIIIVLISAVLFSALTVGWDSAGGIPFIIMGCIAGITVITALITGDILDTLITPEAVPSSKRDS